MLRCADGSHHRMMAVALSGAGLDGEFRHGRFFVEEQAYRCATHHLHGALAGGCLLAVQGAMSAWNVVRCGAFALAGDRAHGIKKAFEYVFNCGLTLMALG